MGKHTYPESLLHLVLPRISVHALLAGKRIRPNSSACTMNGLKPPGKGWQTREYGPNDMTTETALPGAPHYWVLISSFVFIDACLAEVHSVFWAIRRRSRNGVHLRSAGDRRCALRILEKSSADAPAARAAPMATAHLARLRSGIPQSPRASALPATVSNRPPSEASAGGPERNKKCLPNLAAKRPVRSAASAYGTAEACRAPTRIDRRGCSASPTIRSTTRSGVTTGGTGRSALPV
jgi:hypothetical protein